MKAEQNPFCYLCKQTGYAVAAHQILPGGRGVCRDHFQGALMPADSVAAPIDHEIETAREEQREDTNMPVKIEIDLEKLKELHREGLTDGKIGKQLGCSPATARGARINLGLKSNWGSGKAKTLRRTIKTVHRQAAMIERGLEAVTILATEEFCNSIWATLPLETKARLINTLSQLAA